MNVEKPKNKQSEKLIKNIENEADTTKMNADELFNYIRDEIQQAMNRRAGSLKNDKNTTTQLPLNDRIN